MFYNNAVGLGTKISASPRHFAKHSLGGICR